MFLGCHRGQLEVGESSHMEAAALFLGRTMVMGEGRNLELTLFVLRARMLWFQFGSKTKCPLGGLHHLLWPVVRRRL